MSKPVLGVTIGGVLGLLHGLSAWAYPDARAMRATLALMLVAASALPSTSQSQPSATDLTTLGFFLGKWEGTAEGQPGKGTATREYTSQLRSRIIEARHRGEYPPQPANPKGEVHEDLGIYSVDRSAKVIRFRQYHVEGFVVHYVLAPTTKPGTFVFVSEAIENIPPGYRSRETHVVLGPDEFEETFEMADPGKDFEVYSRTRFTRAK